ncbi:hypothetical protein HYALB_00006667 [Hymenoscyphus albidus]|uniref:Zn(2)-C6 fungal-type domain-containing protein n=1 Tax=Hymenoscyphus albidus TaxID=595503 RepID=A0A9N9M012_9HELO|nr:hypothetical protein HYALB_00006667 [Hymenoscyphus albidus]
MSPSTTKENPETSTFPFTPPKRDDGVDLSRDLQESPEQEQDWLTIRRRCETCKTRKVKCDRGQPSCGWCTKNGQSCEYKERKKPGLRAGYGRELEQRLDKLEEVLRSHSQILETFPRRNDSLPSDHGTPPVRPTFRPIEAPRGHVPHAETALFLQKPSSVFSGSQPTDFPSTVVQTPTMSTHPTLPPLHRDIFQQGMQQTMHPHSHAQQPPHPIQTSQSPEFYSTSQAHVQSPSLNVTEPQSEASSEQDLPPYDLLYALVDLYFKHINTWCPILYRQSTLTSLFGSPLGEAEKILLHAIVATTIRFSTDARLTEEKRRYYHDISKQKVLLYGLENSSVKALQALVILALDLVGSGNGPPGWNLLALLTRSVVQLGLSVEPTSFSISSAYPSIYTLRAMVLPEAKDFIEEESRRRLFWMVYLLDRYATIATAFGFALDEKEIDRTLPCRDESWHRNEAVQTRWFHTSKRETYDIDKPENLGTFAYYIEILGILSKIHKFLKAPVDISSLSDVEQWQGKYRKLESMIMDWKFQLPPEYSTTTKLFQPGQSKTSLSCGWVMLHATYHTTVIRLHSSAAYPTNRSNIFGSSYSAGQRCLEAVESIKVLVEYVLQCGMLTKLGPPFAFTLWVAARLLFVHGSTFEHQVNPKIHIFVDTLREMGRYWAVAERYTTILQRVLEEQRDSERSAGPAGERVIPSSVKILADMRRCAYDLDFLISRQPRHVGLVSRMPSITPARTPAPNELEYFETFDFFNFPKLPVANNGNLGNAATMGQIASHEVGNGVNEFNITNFMVDESSDWLFKNQS